jgi:hypothetical protein
MAYSDFLTLKQVEETFGFEQERKEVFIKKKIRAMRISKRLSMDIEDSTRLPILSEKAKSEGIIYPILREINHKNKEFSIFSGYTFDVDKSLSLNGICDFVLSADTKSIDIEAPVFCVVEAKNRSVEEGYGQCAAEMYAAYLFNQKKGTERNIIYGCVTTAFEWAFLQLEGKKIYIDTERYYLNEVGKILTVLQEIINFYKPTTL